jgi:hypothetical protein
VVGCAARVLEPIEERESEATGNQPADDERSATGDVRVFGFGFERFEGLLIYMYHIPTRAFSRAPVEDAAFRTRLTFDATAVGVLELAVFADVREDGQCMDGSGDRAYRVNARLQRDDVGWTASFHLSGDEVEPVRCVAVMPDADSGR